MRGSIRAKGLKEWDAITVTSLEDRILKGCMYVTDRALCCKAALGGISECDYSLESRTRCPDYAVDQKPPVVVL